MFHRSKQGAVDVISGEGPLTADQAESLADQLASCLYGQPRVVLDLRAVPLMDSRALEVLWEAQEGCLRRGGALKLAAPTPLCREILAVTGVGKRFEVFDDTTSAVGSFVR